MFNAPFPRPKSIAGVFGEGAGGTPLPCEPSDTRGCARGGPMLDDEGHVLPSVGITTGKADVFDTGQDSLTKRAVLGGRVPRHRRDDVAVVRIDERVDVVDVGARVAR